MRMTKDTIIINSINPVYSNLGYDKVLESPRYKLKSVKVEFSFKHNVLFIGKYEIKTKITLSEEAIKDEIVRLLQEL